MKVRLRNERNRWSRIHRPELSLHVTTEGDKSFPRWWIVSREVLVVAGAITAFAALFISLTQLDDQRRRFYWERRTNLLDYLYTENADGKPAANATLRSQALLEFLSLDPLVTDGGTNLRGAHLEGTTANCLGLRNSTLVDATTQNMFWEYALLENATISLSAGSMINKSVITNSTIFLDPDTSGLPISIGNSFLQNVRIYSHDKRAKTLIFNSFIDKVVVGKNMFDPATLDDVKSGTRRIDPLSLMKEIAAGQERPLATRFAWVDVDQYVECGDDCAKPAVGTVSAKYTDDNNVASLTRDEWQRLAKGDPSRLLSRCNRRSYRF